MCLLRIIVLPRLDIPATVQAVTKVQKQNPKINRHFRRFVVVVSAERALDTMRPDRRTTFNQ